MTPRTLHRRLIEEGASYRALLESVRQMLAVQRVRSNRLTIEEIAYRLGYTDLANFVARSSDGNRCRLGISRAANESSRRKLGAPCLVSEISALRVGSADRVPRTQVSDEGFHQPLHDRQRAGARSGCDLLPHGVESSAS